MAAELPDVYIVPLDIQPDASDPEKAAKNDVLARSVQVFLGLFPKEIPTGEEVTAGNGEGKKSGNGQGDCLDEQEMAGTSEVEKPAISFWRAEITADPGHTVPAEKPVLAVTADLASSLLISDKAMKFARDWGRPITVLSRHSEEGAIALSYKKLGLNLFDLPWGNEVKWVRYLAFDRMLSLFDKAQGFLTTSNQQALDLETFIDLVRENLQWSRCHELYLALKNALGHGNRDWLQATEHEKIVERVNNEIGKDQFKNLPCQDHCGLIKTLKKDLKSSISSDDCLQWAQQIADLSCSIYRLAQPCLATEVTADVERVKFSKIIVVEDDPGTCEALKRCLEHYADPNDIKILDKSEIELSVKEVKLIGKKDGVFGTLLDEKIAPTKTLICFDLELERGHKHIPDGLCLLYKVRTEHPNLPCIVITGYRSQEYRSLGLKAGSFLLKPFTQQDVDDAIQNAVCQWQVTWLYPQDVQKRDEEVIHNVFADGKIQEKMQACARKILRDYLVHLRVEDAPMEKYGTDLSDSDLFVLDLAPLDLTSEDCQDTGNTVRDVLSTVKQLNPDAPVILVWPFDRWKEIDRLLFGPLRRLFREGIDQVLYKPMWLADYEGSTDSLVGQIIRALKRPSFNVKFTVPLPVAPFIGRFDWGYIRKDLSSVRSEKAFAPFLIPLIRAFGLSASLKDLKEGWNYGLKVRLAKAVQDEVMQNRNRWGGFEKTHNKKEDESCQRKITRLKRILSDNEQVGQGSACEIEMKKLLGQFNAFIEFVQSEDCPYLTPEDWIRAQCFPDVQERLNDVVRLFGGETRFDLLARGSWLDESGTRVEDVLIVVEFLANLSVVSREFVEEKIIQPLLNEYGEDAAILQEIPVQGYMHFR